jgi:hypothetical protein
MSLLLLLLLLLLFSISSRHPLRLHAVVVDGHSCTASIKVARVLRLQKCC